MPLRERDIIPQIQDIQAGFCYIVLHESPIVERASSCVHAISASSIWNLLNNLCIFS
jgi:hypothetical protein